MAYTLHKDLTTVNYTKGNNGRKYIVIHYTGNKTDTAKGNANYFRSTNRGASAHYFVDKSTVYQVVDDANTSWAVGKNYGSNNKFSTVKNNNSISIEMCSDGGKIADETFANTVALVKELMKKYNITAGNVYRHYDVCSKSCPGWSGWLGSNPTLWTKFKSSLTGAVVNTAPSTVVSQSSGSGGSNTSPAVKADSWVTRLQEECNDQGFSNQKVDGIQGKNTLAGCPTIRYGAKGNITKLMQERLNALGYSCGSADGKFGDKTKAAVIAYQRAKGILADGIVGQITWSKMLGLS